MLLRTILYKTYKIRYKIYKRRYKSKTVYKNSIVLIRI